MATIEKHDTEKKERTTHTSKRNKTLSESKNTIRNRCKAQKRGVKTLSSAI